jgi:hypothetical protein
MSGLDTLAIVMICIGVGIGIGCCCAYFLLCCSNGCFVKIQKETSSSEVRANGLNPMFRAEGQKNKDDASINEDPV